MASQQPIWDAIVAGAGIAGATAALDLKRSLGATARVLLCDPALAPQGKAATAPSFRAVAVAPDIRAYLDALGVWNAVSPHAQPIHAMTITDGRPGLLPHPALLHFGTAEAGAEPLASMVFADELRDALVRACEAAGVMVDGGTGSVLQPEPWSLALTLSDGRRHRTRLLVAADGSRSRLRHAARIQVIERDYPQAAIVATLAHTEDHGGEAIQHFLPAGPVALLPLRAADGSGRRLSLVWTVDVTDATRLAALTPTLFCETLEQHIGLRFGRLQLEDEPRVQALTLRVARRLTAGRLVLVGDAARVIHPLAGQGLNLGLRDAQALARHVKAVADLGLDPGSRHVLETFEAERRPESLAIAAGTDLLDRLFSTDQPVIRAARDVGLGVVERTPALKRSFARTAGAGRWS